MKTHPLPLLVDGGPEWCIEEASDFHGMQIGLCEDLEEDVELPGTKSNRVTTLSPGEYSSKGNLLEHSVLP